MGKEGKYFSVQKVRYDLDRLNFQRLDKFWTIAESDATSMVDLGLAVVGATQGNARENGLTGGIIAVQGSSECLKGPFDLVAAHLSCEAQMGRGGGVASP